MNNVQITNLINRITDGDNITLEDAFTHVAMITDRSVGDIEKIWLGL